MKKRVDDFIKNVLELLFSNLLILQLWRMIITKPGDIISSIEMSRILRNLLGLNRSDIGLTTMLANIITKDKENKWNI